MEFVYDKKITANTEEMEMLVEAAQKFDVSMIYTQETFNDCGEKEIKSNVFGVWFQVNDPYTRKDNIEKMWSEFRTQKTLLCTGWHEKSGAC
jgi:hypothetical protein